MRFVKLKTRASQGRGESTAEPQQQQQQSYLQRVCSQLASLRVSYQSKSSNKSGQKNKNTQDTEEDTDTAETSCKRVELTPADQDFVHHLGSSDSEHYTASQYHQPKSDNAPDDQGTENSPSKKQTPRYHLLSWGEAKTRLQQTTTVIRDICVAKSSALLSSAWRVYPRTKEVTTPPFSPSSSSSSGADTPPRKHRMKEREQYAQWVMTTAGRESEISICMSYYSSRSLSDAATDSEDQQQNQQHTRKRNSSSSSSSSSSFSDRMERERENDLFRLRCSSTDSYRSILKERYSNGSGSARRGKRGDGEEGKEDEDFDDETIRDSLFVLNGKPYKAQSEWI